MITDKSLQKEFATLFRPICPLCGANGELIYENLQDNLFGSPGKWNFRQCLNQTCRLVWIDPIPCQEDIGMFYNTYFTHPTVRKERIYLLRFILSKSFWKLFDLFLYPTRLYRERVNLSFMYLKDVRPGRLLEVGCGNGHFLDLMRSKGWEVEGVEVDSQAVQVAKTTFKLHVREGTLEEAHYPDAFFDVITMNHVIEHVYEPITLLKECRRILKPQGFFIATTPNMQGLGHIWFKENWVGLDPPRHLHIFSKNNILPMAVDAGFSEVKVWTTSGRAREFALGSSDIQLKRAKVQKGLFFSFKKAFSSVFFELKALSTLRADPDSGEEIVLMAKR